MQRVAPQRGVRIHRIVRSITQWWPHHFAAAAFNRILEWALPRLGEPRWVESPPSGSCPSMVLDLNDRLQRKTYYFPRAYARYYLQAPLARWMRRMLGPGRTFVDVGANLGFFTLLAASLVGARGAVWAFEPQPHLFESLSRSVSLNGLDNVTCFPVALSDRPSEAVLHGDPNGLASSLVDEHPRRAHRYSSAIRVRADSLDHVVQESQLDAGGIRMVKVDVEGEEPRTVAGMIETLERAGRPPVWCEVRGPRGSTRAPDTYEPVRSLLWPLGYRPHRTDGDPLRPSDLRARGSLDVLFQCPA